MSNNRIFRSLSLQALDTPLGSIRLLGVFSFAFTAGALLVPHMHGFFTGGAISMTGVLLVQLF